MKDGNTIDELSSRFWGNNHFISAYLFMSLNLRWKIAQTAELIWWKRYLKKRSTENYLTWKKDYWKTFLSKIGLGYIDQPSNSTLDLGCGPAGIFILFQHSHIEALDPLLDDYEAHLPHFKKSFYPNVVFHPSSIESYLPQKSFDYVFCLNAINHVADLPGCFDKMVACVSAKGTLVLSIDAHNHSLLKKLFRLIPGDILHPHQYDLQEYTHMLLQRGCTIQQTVLYKKETIFTYYILVATKRSMV